MSVLRSFAFLFAATVTALAQQTEPEQAAWQISISGKIEPGTIVLEYRRDGRAFEALRTKEVGVSQDGKVKQSIVDFDGPPGESSFDFKIYWKQGNQVHYYNWAGGMAPEIVSVGIISPGHTKSWILKLSRRVVSQGDREITVEVRKLAVVGPQRGNADGSRPPVVAQPLKLNSGGQSSLPVNEIADSPDPALSMESLAIEAWAKSLPESETGSSGELVLLITEVTNAPMGQRFNFGVRLAAAGGQWVHSPGAIPKSFSLFRFFELADRVFVSKSDKYLPLGTLSCALPVGGASRTFDVIAAECSLETFREVAKGCTANTLDEFRQKLASAKDVVLLSSVSGSRTVPMTRSAPVLVSYSNMGYSYELRLELVGKNVPGRADFEVAAFKDFGSSMDQKVFGGSGGGAGIDRSKILRYFDYMDVLSADSTLSLAGVFLPPDLGNVSQSTGAIEPKFLHWAPTKSDSMNRLPLDAFLTFDKEGGELFVVDRQGVVRERSSDREIGSLVGRIKRFSEEMAALFLGEEIPAAAIAGPAPEKEAVSSVSSKSDAGTAPRTDSNPERSSAFRDKIQDLAFEDLSKGPLVFSHPALTATGGIQIQVSGQGLQTGLPFEGLIRAGELTVKGSGITRWFKLVNGRLEATWPSLVDKQNGSIDPSKDRLSFAYAESGIEPMPPALDKDSPEALRRGLLLCAHLQLPVSVSSPFRETQKLLPYVRADGSLELPLSDAAIRRFQLQVFEKRAGLGSFPISRESVGGWTLELTDSMGQTSTFVLPDRDDISLQQILAKMGTESLAGVSQVTLSFVKSGSYANGIRLGASVAEAFKESFSLSTLAKVGIEIPSEDLYKPITIEPKNFEGLFPAVYMDYSGEEYLVLTRFARERFMIRGKEREFGTEPKTWKWDSANKSYTPLAKSLEMKPALLRKILPLDAVLDSLSSPTAGPAQISKRSAFRGCEDVMKNLAIFQSLKAVDFKSLFPSPMEKGVFPLEFVVGNSDDGGKNWRPVDSLFLLPQDGKGSLPCEPSVTSPYVFRRVLEGTAQQEFSRLEGGFELSIDADGRERLSSLQVMDSGDKFPRNQTFKVTASQPRYFLSTISPELSDVSIASPLPPEPPAGDSGPLHVVFINESLDINLLTLVVKKVHTIAWKVADETKSRRNVQFHIVFQGPSDRQVVSGELAPFEESAAPSIPSPGVALVLSNFGPDRMKSALDSIERELGSQTGTYLIFVNAAPNPDGPENAFRQEQKDRLDRLFTGTGGFDQAAEQAIIDQFRKFLPSSAN